MTSKGFKHPVTPCGKTQSPRTTSPLSKSFKLFKGGTTAGLSEWIEANADLVNFDYIVYLQKVKKK